MKDQFTVMNLLLIYTEGYNSMFSLGLEGFYSTMMQNLSSLMYHMIFTPG